MFVHDNYASYQDARTHVFIIGTSVVLILELKVTVILFVDDKYVSNQYAKTRVYIMYHHQSGWL